MPTTTYTKEHRIASAMAGIKMGLLDPIHIAVSYSFYSHPFVWLTDAVKLDWFDQYEPDEKVAGEESLEEFIKEMIGIAGLVRELIETPRMKVVSSRPFLLSKQRRY